MQTLKLNAKNILLVNAHFIQLFQKNINLRYFAQPLPVAIITQTFSTPEYCNHVVYYDIKCKIFEG
jgi:hypothetical protein